MYCRERMRIVEGLKVTYAGRQKRSERLTNFSLMEGVGSSMHLELAGGSALLRRLLLRRLFISQKVLIKSCCKSQFLHKPVNLFFILVIVKDKLTDIWGFDFCKTT